MDLNSKIRSHLQSLKKKTVSLQELLHPFINLDAYYSLKSSIWEEDWPFIERIDAYLKKNMLPSMFRSRR
ncbi:hypothetical protein ASG93_08475 [Paenibacillus sp. Soil787]|nr:hypothetical protein ASG93_08475 [Paenibacillus sp. Soil787]